MCEIHKRFAQDWKDCLDFSDEAIIEAFNGESYGSPVSKFNGFYQGKKWAGVMVTMWKEDIEKGLLTRKELYDDFPSWWLDKVL